MNRTAEATPEARPVPHARAIQVVEPSLAPWSAPMSRPTARFLKRALDLAVSVILLLPVGLLMLAVAIALFASHGRPVLYGHRRVGHRGRSFRCWKFRTMVPDAERVLADHLAADADARQEWERDHKLRQDPRITRLGVFLRRTSLDELPQIWNVLIGDMSLVGPRPIVEAEIEKYADHYAAYSSVKPGITGLWQVSGRNNTSYDERVALDVEYVNRWSPWTDLRILARTLRVVLFAEGAC